MLCHVPEMPVAMLEPLLPRDGCSEHPISWHTIILILQLLNNVMLLIVLVRNWPAV